MSATQLGLRAGPRAEITAKADPCLLGLAHILESVMAISMYSLMCLQFDTRRTPAPQVSLKSQDALSHSYHSARHECNVNRARAEGDTEVHFYHGEHHFHAMWLPVRMLSFLSCTDAVCCTPSFCSKGIAIR